MHKDGVTKLTRGFPFLFMEDNKPLSIKFDSYQQSVKYATLPMHLNATGNYFFVFLLLQTQNKSTYLTQSFLKPRGR